MADERLATNGAATGVSTPNVTAQPNGAVPSAQPQAPQAQPQAAPERPRWLPEKFKTPEDFAKSYGELEGRLSRSGRAEEQLKEWTQWGDPKTLNSRLNDYVRQQVQQAVHAHTQQAQQAVDWDAIEDFASVHPKQFAQAVKAEALRDVNSVIEQRWAQAQQEIANIRNEWDQRQKIQNAAMIAKMNTPELRDVDINDIYRTMLEIASGDQNSLMGLAITQLTNGAAREADTRAIEARVRADMELAERNKAQEGVSGLLRRFQGTPERPKGKEAIKASILKQGLEKGFIKPENM